MIPTVSAMALREGELESLSLVAERGVANATAGLSEMVGRPIDVRALGVSFQAINEVPRVLAGPEDVLVGVYLAIWGDLAGHILLLFSLVEA